MTKQRLAYTLLVAALLSGCSLIPDYDRPLTDVPPGWSEADVGSPTYIARDWWKNFNSAELNAFMQQALTNNNDLNAALARVEQARGLARAAGAPLLPSVDALGNAGWQRVDPGEGKTQSDSTGAVGLSIGYELDLFGKNRASLESANKELESASFSSDAIALIVMGDVAKGYFNVLNLEERLNIADQNLESSRELLRIVQARFDAGATTLLDVAQQKSDLASSEASRATIEQQLKIARNALAVLLGQAPQSLQVQATELRTLSVPDIAPGQPSNLIERRPDIRAAETLLEGTNADIGVARAAFFPSVTLGLDWTIAATPLGDPATTTLSILSGLTAPLFKGGLLEGNLQYTEGRKLELIENYRKTVLVSFKDVEDALASVKAAQQREASLATALTESRKAYDLSKQQYDVGSIDFQDLLNTRRTMLTAEDNYVQTKNERLAAAVDLYKALGGGWAQDEQAAAPMPVSTPSPLSPSAPSEKPVDMFAPPATNPPVQSTPDAPARAPISTSPGRV